MTIKRGDMFYADLSPVVGSEQGGIRPVVIIQNDLGNKYSPTVIAAAITSQTSKTKLPTHIDVDCKTCGLKRKNRPYRRRKGNKPNKQCTRSKFRARITHNNK